MSDGQPSLAIDRAGFDCVSDSDALRADRLCQGLLLRFYEELVASGEDPVAATAWARGADYFLRDFLIDIKRANLFNEEPGMVRQFAGNWYIVTNLEPELEVLAGHLEGVRRFYRFLGDHGEISAHHVAQVEQECSDLDYYGRRIDSFWELGDGGFPAWDSACPYRTTTIRGTLQ